MLRVPLGELTAPLSLAIAGNQIPFRPHTSDLQLIFDNFVTDNIIK